MARPGLLLDLQNAIGKAKKEKATIRRQNVQVKNGNGNGEGQGKTRRGTQPPADSVRLVNFDVIPISVSKLEETYFMIVFQDAVEDTAQTAASVRILSDKRSEAASGRISKLEQELAATKEYLQSVIETRKLQMRNCSPQTRRSFRVMKSCKAPMRSWKQQKKSCNLRTRN